MSIVAIIPARGGSKRLPGKNLLPLAGRPLIAHTCRAALDSGVLDAVYVNTDSPEIAKVAADFGAACPVLRPAHLATDESPTRDALVFMLEVLAECGHRFDTLVLLQPTSPLRTADDIRAGLKLYADNSPCTVVAVTAVAPHGWLGHIAPDGQFERWTGDALTYRLNGALYIYPVAEYLADRLPDKTIAYVMPPARSIDIDTAEDLEYARYRLRDTAEKLPALE